MENIDIDRLELSAHKPAGYVPKVDSSTIELLEEHGPIQPVVVRPATNGKFEILANVETWIAAGRAGLHEVPVRVLTEVSDTEAATIVRKHYGAAKQNAVDEARFFEAELLRRGGRDQRGAITRVAALTGNSRPYVAHSLRLLSLPQRVVEMIEEGRLSAGQARPLITVPTALAKTELAERIALDGLSARDAEKLCAEKRGDRRTTTSKQPTKTQPSKKDPNTVRLEREVSTAIGAEFTIDEGRAIINFHDNLDILDGILQRLGYQA